MFGLHPGQGIVEPGPSNRGPAGQGQPHRARLGRAQYGLHPVTTSSAAFRLHVDVCNEKRSCSGCLIRGRCGRHQLSRQGPRLAERVGRVTGETDSEQATSHQRTRPNVFVQPAVWGKIFKSHAQSVGKLRYNWNDY